MLAERQIPEEWVQRTLDSPESEEMDEEGLFHLFRAIPEFGGRVIHVIIDRQAQSPRVVTLFFDRRARRER